MIHIDVGPDNAPQCLRQLFIAARIEKILLIVRVVIVRGLFQFHDVEHVVTVFNTLKCYARADVIAELLTQRHAELNMVGLNKAHM